MWIRPLDHDLPLADASCGAKARGLAALRAAGLPVPDGFVITDEAFRAVVGAAHLPAEVEHVGEALGQLAAAIEASQPPPQLADEVTARAQLLGPLAVRSSISLEDRGAGAAAGVFSSELAVAPQHVWPAIRAVWASVCTPLAVEYARLQHHGGTPGPLTVAVIVQRYVPGDRLTVYTREPGAPTAETAWLERGAALRKLPRDADEPALQLALRAERALGLEAGGADVELIARHGGDRERADADDATAGTFVVVQARPIVHPPRAVRRPAPPIVVSALVADGRRWTADLAHNPDPLSPAQAGLVERIEREGASPYALRLCAGTLYSTPREAPSVEAPRTVEALRRRFADAEARAAAALGAPSAHDLPATLAAYLRLYRVWSFEMSPLVAAARRAALAATSEPLPAQPGSRPSAVEAIVIACARGELTEAELLERIGDLSPAWDVAAPTLAETPQRIAAALLHARSRRRASSDAPTAPRAAPTLGEVAAELAEVDDLWFARAQARVRRALLARGAQLGLGDDVFWLPLEDLLSPEPIEVETARAKASGARAAHRRAAAWRMPVIVGGTAPTLPRLRGVGFGGAVSGRVVHLHNLWEPPVLPLGAIAVVPAVTPALAVALLGVAAIVSETGGLLEHGAAMARELGIPCVVGCTDAMSLPPHALVLVDGAAGLVTELEPT